MSLKDEKRHEDFSRLLWLDMVKHRDIWFLENRVPTLGEVRGKAIIMGRFWCSEPSQFRCDYADIVGPDDDSWENGMGWRIPDWGPPVKGLEFDCGGTKGILQDWYGMSSFLDIPEKFAIVGPSNPALQLS
jgi:1-phosphatidylinositol phosphodiesterase